MRCDHIVDIGKQIADYDAYDTGMFSCSPLPGQSSAEEFSTLVQYPATDAHLAHQSQPSPFSLVAAQSLDQDRYLLLVTYSDRLTNSKGSLIDAEARILNAERKEASKTSGHCQDFDRDANVF